VLPWRPLWIRCLARARSHRHLSAAMDTSKTQLTPTSSVRVCGSLRRAQRFRLFRSLSGFTRNACKAMQRGNMRGCRSSEGTSLQGSAQPPSDRPNQILSDMVSGFVCPPGSASSHFPTPWHRKEVNLNLFEHEPPATVMHMLRTRSSRAHRRDALAVHSHNGLDQQAHLHSRNVPPLGLWTRTYFGRPSQQPKNW
jgi:hypothetical protein